jgi:flap endonuclease-1
MGIKNLTVILNTHCKSAVNKRNLDAYKGRILGIDISIFLYKYLYMNDDHLEGIMRLLLRILKNGILPLVIFDGRPPKEKSEVLTSRKEKREYLVTKRDAIETAMEMMREFHEEMPKEELKNEIKKVIEEKQESKGENTKLEDEDIQDLLTKNTEELKDELDKTVKRIIYVRAEHIESLKMMLQHMGLPYIVSKGEAESLMGHLCAEGIIDGCISEDTDVLVNGGKIFLRNIAADKNGIDEYCLEGILTGLGMTFEQFIDMCILCGCDYTSKIGGMGPQTAYKMMKKYGDLESVLAELKKRPDKYEIPEGENFDYEKARFLFQHSTDEEDREEIKRQIKVTNPDLPNLISMMRSTKLGDKYFDEIQKYYMNYMSNIKRHLPMNSRELFIEKPNSPPKAEKTKSKKITDFFQKHD